jgi:hypothetical protein
MIKGIKPSLAEGGKIKIGKLGEKRTSRSGREYRLPVKLDHFLITKTSRNGAGDLEIDEKLMRAMNPDPDDKVREIPIVLHSDEIDEVFPTAYAAYYGKRLACRGDGEKATRWEFDQQGNRTGKDEERKCPCPFLGAEKGIICKPHGTLHCSIALAEMAVAGSVYKWRTTSMISIQRMIGSLQQIQATCGTMRGIPLTLRIEPVTVTPPGSGTTTVFCCHVELRATDLLEVQRRALDLAQMRRAVSGELEVQVAYRGLIEAPAANESPEEQEEIAAEFFPEDEPAPEMPEEGKRSFIQPPEPDPGPPPLGDEPPDEEPPHDPETGEAEEPETSPLSAFSAKEAIETIKAVPDETGSMKMMQLQMVVDHDTRKTVVEAAADKIAEIQAFRARHTDTEQSKQTSW